MTTKAELEAELAALRREVRQQKEVRESSGTGGTPATEEEPAQDVDELQKFLEGIDVDADSVESLGTKFLAELTSLQENHPLVVLATAFAVGCVVGRNSAGRSS